MDERETKIKELEERIRKLEAEKVVIVPFYQPPPPLVVPSPIWIHPYPYWFNSGSPALEPYTITYCSA